jgi:hypothetical protein
VAIASAVVDISSVVFGVLGLIVGALGILSGRHEHKEATRLRERAHAEKVSAWADKRTDEGRRVLARNGSEQVVRDVNLWLITRHAPAAGEEAPQRDPTARRAVLEPGETFEHLIPATAMKGASPKERPSVVLAFRDADGREWLRTADDHLVRING